MEPVGLEPTSAHSGVQLAELVAAIALAADLGLGQPLDHVLRACIIATRFAEHLGATREERDATYWVTLFVTAGCTGVSFELTQLFGDDIAFRAGIASVGASTRSNSRFLHIVQLAPAWPNGLDLARRSSPPFGRRS